MANTTAKQTDEQRAATTVNLKGRFSYFNGWQPKAMTNAQGQPQGAPKFSVSLIISKDDVEEVEKAKAAIEAARLQGKDSKWGGKFPPNLKMPLRDGDKDRPDNEEYKNSYFITASSTTKPGIVNRRKEAITDETEVYSGAYGKLNVNFYPFNTNGSKGVACGLNHVQKLEDGEALSGRPSADEAFEDEGDDGENLAG